MISMHLFGHVRSLIDAGLNNSEIAKRLKIDRGTVRKYRNSNSPPKYTERLNPTRANKLETFEGKIAEWLASDRKMSGTSIYLFIKEQGYDGCQRSVERRVEALRAKLPKERFFEQQYTPAEQAQFDFKERVSITFCHGVEVCHYFIGTLPYSGRFFAKAFPNKTYEAFSDGFHSFFEAIGGMPEKIRFDNLSPVVKKVLKGSDRQYTKAFERAIDYYDFKLLPCGPGKGNEKGDCERDIRTFSRRISEFIKLSGRIFSDFDDLNQWLAKFSLDQLTEAQKLRYAEEILLLKPVPPQNEAVLCNVILATVGKYGTVGAGKSRYSVPDDLILQPVKIVVSPYDVKIFRISPKIELRATHPRMPDSTSSILLEHAITSLVRKPQAMVRWAHRAILFPDPIFDRYYKYLQKTLENGAEAEFLKSLNLIHFAQLAEIKVGIEIILDTESPAPFFDLKALVLGPSENKVVSIGGQALCQPPLNTELADYDSLIPAS